MEGGKKYALIISKNKKFLINHKDQGFIISRETLYNENGYYQVIFLQYHPLTANMKDIRTP